MIIYFCKFYIHQCFVLFTIFKILNILKEKNESSLNNVENKNISKISCLYSNFICYNLFQGNLLIGSLRAPKGGAKVEAAQGATTDYVGIFKDRPEPVLF